MAENESLDLCASRRWAYLPPMTGMLWGGRVTRGCHPQFLRMMGDLVTAVAGRRTAFSLPFKRWTKAEMVRRLADLGLADLVPDAVSCIHFPLRLKGANQCGLCPGCLGTRQALAAAGLPPGTGAYRDDIFHRRCNELAPDVLAFLREQVLQVADLHDLTADGAKPQILRRHLGSSRAITIADSPAQWAKLLGRFRDEWMKVISAGRAAGCRWASWIEGYDANDCAVRHGGTDDERLEQIGSEELQRAACSVP